MAGPMLLDACAASAADARVADEIATLLCERARAGRTLVLGLATGRSPAGVYRELVARHLANALPVAALRTFNLDEYLGLAPSDARSFHAQMRRQLFEPLGLAPAQWNIPRGDLEPARWSAHCAAYAQAIRDAGGIDLQLLGLGRNGHVGFNEPGSACDSRVRAVELARETREDAAFAFGGLDAVPTHAISIGIADILAAARIRVFVYGAAKHAALRAALDGPPSVERPLSWLAAHADVHVYTDAAVGAPR
ncbi:MAG: glucosamine-6-phosphate deaminase [Planctomycetota bacterium]|nr:MAG: glucosamine-6-phosphate deaminase [Planctomycetota bacterium]